MTRRLLMTLIALVSVMALSASVAVAAAPAKTSGRLPSAAASGSGHGCSQSSATVITSANAVKPTSAGHGKPEVKPADNEDSDADENVHERPQNHGWFVSQVAKDHSLTGRAHGEAVSAVAKSDQGKPAAAAH